MAIPEERLNPDGSLKPFSPSEIAAMNIRWRGVREGTAPALAFETNANRGEASVFVTWAQRWNFVLYAVGLSVVYAPEPDEEEDPDPDNRISRLLPFRMPGREGLVVTKVTGMTGHQFLGTVDADGMPEFRDAEVRLLFESPKYKIKSDADTFSELERYIEFGDAEPTGEVISVIGGSMKFWRDPGGENPAALPNGIPVPWPSINKQDVIEAFEVTWWNLPESMIQHGSDWRRRLIGTAGQDDVPLLNAINSTLMWSYPAGTLRFAGVRIIRDSSPLGDGSIVGRAVMKFEAKPSGWNALYFSSATSPNLNGHYMIGSDGYAAPDVVGDKDSLYPARDLFGEVFRP